MEASYKYMLMQANMAAQDILLKAAMWSVKYK